MTPLPASTEKSLSKEWISRLLENEACLENLRDYLLLSILINRAIIMPTAAAGGLFLSEAYLTVFYRLAWGSLNKPS